MDIDLSKENVRPLRGGRDQGRLGTALQADASALLAAERREREEAVRAYEGPDPLAPWFDYVLWVEQSFPKRHLDRLVKECLARFEADERYLQDPRLVRLWIRYAERSERPLELYQTLHNRGVGTGRAEMYAAWATHCEEAQDYRKAERVYVLGAAAGASPEAELERAHQAFRGRYAQRTLHEDDSPTKRKAAQALAETRMALASLAGRNPQPWDRPQPAPALRNARVPVYEDRPGPSHFPPSYDARPDPAAPAPSLLSPDRDENRRDPAAWNDGGAPALPAAARPPPPPPFAPYEDDELMLAANHAPLCREDLTAFSARVCLPDPPDPARVSAYDKALVYPDGEGVGRELSPEEVRAPRYRPPARVAPSVDDSMTVNTEAAHRTLNLFGDASAFPPLTVEPLAFSIREDDPAADAPPRAPAPPSDPGPFVDENAYPEFQETTAPFDATSLTRMFSSVPSASTPFRTGAVPDSLYPIIESTSERRSGFGEGASRHTPARFEESLRVLAGDFHRGPVDDFRAAGGFHQSPPGSFHRSPAANFHQSPPGNYHQGPPADFHQSSAADFRHGPAGNFHQSPAPTFHRSPAESYHQTPVGNFHQGPARNFLQSPSGGFHQGPAESFHQGAAGIHQMPAGGFHHGAVGSFHHGPLEGFHQIQSYHQGGVGNYQQSPVGSFHQIQTRDYHQSPAGDFHQSLTGNLHRSAVGDFHHQSAVGNYHRNGAGSFHQTPAGSYHPSPAENYYHGPVGDYHGSGGVGNYHRVHPGGYPQSPVPQPRNGCVDTPPYNHGPLPSDGTRTPEYRSPTSRLRSVRHDGGQGLPRSAGAGPDFDGGDGPRDNADAPKFRGGPGISQKMRRDLYVSSPERAQVPPEADGSADTALPERGDPARARTDGDGDASCGRLAVSFRSECSDVAVATEDLPRPARVDLPEVVDPFNSELCDALLRYVRFPNRNHHEGYAEVRSVPKLQQGTAVTVDQSRFSVERQLGKGTFGCVFRGVDLLAQEPVALKYQRPGHPWEYYVCREVRARIRDPFMLPGYMDVRRAFFGDNASILVSEPSAYGSLLDVANRIKTATAKCMGEFVVMLLASEMLSILHHLHRAEIIHADIKPDNFLVMKIPQTESRTPSLQLIDFGCAIDMSLFPPGTTFRKVISTDGFTCSEMKEGRPWTYQTDLYCLAGTVYVILMGSYMRTVDRGGRWAVEKKWPRYMKSAVWDKVFAALLNVKDCSNIPDLLEVKDSLDEFLRFEETNLSSQLRNFEHVLKCK